MEVWITNIHPKVKLRLEKLRSLALKALPQMDEGRLHIVLTDDPYITKLNRRFTGREAPHGGEGLGGDLHLLGPRCRTGTGLWNRVGG